MDQNKSKSEPKHGTIHFKDMKCILDPKGRYWKVPIELTKYGACEIYCCDLYHEVSKVIQEHRFFNKAKIQSVKLGKKIDMPHSTNFWYEFLFTCEPYLDLLQFLVDEE